MPELPEVETVARGLATVLEGQTIASVTLSRPDLRRPFPPDLGRRLRGVQVVRVYRRAKYALLDTDRHDTVLVHLGMSGRVLIDPADTSPHDHMILTTRQGQRVVLRDPRRFGLVDITPTHALERHDLLAHLGPEPLSQTFTDAMFAQALAAKRGPLKTVLLDQRVVAGLGNIYVCEALFAAGLHPERSARTVSARKTSTLKQEIQGVLTRAIEAGGSSLRDYAQVDGELGYFQHAWQVYGREGLPCQRCSRPIRRSVQSGRSSFYCAACQR